MSPEKDKQANMHPWKSISNKHVQLHTWRERGAAECRRLAAEGFDINAVWAEVGEEMVKTPLSGGENR